MNTYAVRSAFVDDLGRGSARRMHHLATLIYPERTCPARNATTWPSQRGLVRTAGGCKSLPLQNRSPNSPKKGCSSKRKPLRRRAIEILRAVRLRPGVQVVASTLRTYMPSFRDILATVRSRLRLRKPFVSVQSEAAAYSPNDPRTND
jgi:hypothetical protein